MDGFIILGATPRAQRVLEFLRSVDLDHLVQAFCVLDKEQCGTPIMGKPALLWDKASAMNLPILLAVESPALPVAQLLLSSSESPWFTNVVRLLSTQFDLDATELNRAYCCFAHEHHMDDYYAKAEGKLDIFWGADSPFLRLFQTLDLTDVVELACGHGRHVGCYLDRAGSVTLVDVLEANIEFCRKRYADADAIRFYHNNGSDLSELDDSSYSALFTYDSMVHFELFDIFGYLKETRRILRKGGRALFHHSNLTIDPKQSFTAPRNPGSRTYMSKDLFAHLAYQAGLTVIEQQVIDWSLPEMDCLTLVEKE